MEILNYKLLGAIAGDIAGSTYEFTRNRPVVKSWPTNEIPLCPEHSQFTDDSVCTLGIADTLMTPYIKEDYSFDFVKGIQKWCRAYSEGRGYGGSFYHWFHDENPVPYNSWGNGSAMRVSSIGWYAKDTTECVKLATQSAAISHNHPEGIKGAVAIALAVWSAVHGLSKETIKESILDFYYPEWANKTIAEIKPTYSFDVSCQGSVPVALICFLESENYEDCLQKAISLCGDSDTIAAMAGGIAYPFYGEMQETTLHKALGCLDDNIIETIERFDKFIDERNN